MNKFLLFFLMFFHFSIKSSFPQFLTQRNVIEAICGVFFTKEKEFILGFSTIGDLCQLARTCQILQEHCQAILRALRERYPRFSNKNFFSRAVYFHLRKRSFHTILRRDINDEEKQYIEEFLLKLESIQPNNDNKHGLFFLIQIFASNIEIQMLLNFWNFMHVMLKHLKTPQKYFIPPLGFIDGGINWSKKISQALAILKKLKLNQERIALLQYIDLTEINDSNLFIHTAKELIALDANDEAEKLLMNNLHKIPVIQLLRLLKKKGQIIPLNAILPRLRAHIFYTHNFVLIEITQLVDLLKSIESHLAVQFLIDISNKFKTKDDIIMLADPLISLANEVNLDKIENYQQGIFNIEEKLILAKKKAKATQLLNAYNLKNFHKILKIHHLLEIICGKYAPKDLKKPLDLGYFSIETLSRLARTCKTLAAHCQPILDALRERYPRCFNENVFFKSAYFTINSEENTSFLALMFNPEKIDNQFITNLLSKLDELFRVFPMRHENIRGLKFLIEILTFLLEAQGKSTLNDIQRIIQERYSYELKNYLPIWSNHFFEASNILVELGFNKEAIYLLKNIYNMITHEFYSVQIAKKLISIGAINEAVQFASLNLYRFNKIDIFHLIEIFITQEERTPELIELIKNLLDKHDEPNISRIIELVSTLKSFGLKDLATPFLVKHLKYFQKVNNIFEAAELLISLGANDEASEFLSRFSPFNSPFDSPSDSYDFRIVRLACLFKSSNAQAQAINLLDNNKENFFNVSSILAAAKLFMDLDENDKANLLLNTLFKKSRPRILSSGENIDDVENIAKEMLKSIQRDKDSKNQKQERKILMLEITFVKYKNTEIAIVFGLNKFNIGISAKTKIYKDILGKVFVTNKTWGLFFGFKLKSVEFYAGIKSGNFSCKVSFTGNRFSLTGINRI